MCDQERRQQGQTNFAVLEKASKDLTRTDKLRSFREGV